MNKIKTANFAGLVSKQPCGSRKAFVIMMQLNEKLMLIKLNV